MNVPCASIKQKVEGKAKSRKTILAKAWKACKEKASSHSEELGRLEAEVREITDHFNNAPSEEIRAEIEKKLDAKTDELKELRAQAQREESALNREKADLGGGGLDSKELNIIIQPMSGSEGYAIWAQKDGQLTGSTEFAKDGNEAYEKAKQMKARVGAAHIAQLSSLFRSQKKAEHKKRFPPGKKAGIASKSGKAGRVMVISDRIMNAHNKQSGTAMGQEPLKSEFLNAVRSLGKLSPEDSAELENENFHTELAVLMEAGIAPRPSYDKAKAGKDEGIIDSDVRDGWYYLYYQSGKVAKKKLDKDGKPIGPLIEVKKAGVAQKGSGEQFIANKYFNGRSYDSLAPAEQEKFDKLLDREMRVEHTMEKAGVAQLPASMTKQVQGAPPMDRRDSKLASLWKSSRKAEGRCDYCGKVGTVYPFKFAMENRDQYGVRGHDRFDVNLCFSCLREAEGHTQKAGGMVCAHCGKKSEPKPTGFIPGIPLDKQPPHVQGKVAENFAIYGMQGKEKKKAWHAECPNCGGRDIRDTRDGKQQYCLRCREVWDKEGEDYGYEKKKAETSEFDKERKEHPSFSDEQIKQIVADHGKKSEEGWASCPECKKPLTNFGNGKYGCATCGTLHQEKKPEPEKKAGQETFTQWLERRHNITPARAGGIQDAGYQKLKREYESEKKEGMTTRAQHSKELSHGTLPKERLAHHGAMKEFAEIEAAFIKEGEWQTGGIPYKYEWPVLEKNKDSYKGREFFIEHNEHSGLEYGLIHDVQAKVIDGENWLVAKVRVPETNFTQDMLARIENGLIRFVSSTHRFFSDPDDPARRVQSITGQAISTVLDPEIPNARILNCRRHIKAA